MSNRVKTTLSKPNLSVKSISRVSAIYNICYEILKIFKAPKHAYKTLYSGIIQEQALQGIILRYISPDDIIEFELKLTIDWNLHHVIVQTAKGSQVQVNKRLSSVEQFVGNKEGFKQLYKHIIRTKRIKKKKIYYPLIEQPNTPRYDQVLQRLNLSTSSDSYTQSGTYTSYTISSSELEETSISIRIRDGGEQPSVLRQLLNVFRW